MAQQKPPLIVTIHVSVQFLTAVLTDEGLFNVNCQLGDISQRHQHANPAFSINMLGHTVVNWHLYTDKMCVNNSLAH